MNPNGPILALVHKPGIGWVYALQVPGSPLDIGHLPGRRSAYPCLAPLVPTLREASVSTCGALVLILQDDLAENDGHPWTMTDDLQDQLAAAGVPLHDLDGRSRSEIQRIIPSVNAAANLSLSTDEVEEAIGVALILLVAGHSGVTEPSAARPDGAGGAVAVNTSYVEPHTDTRSWRGLLGNSLGQAIYSYLKGAGLLRDRPGLQDRAQKVIDEARRLAEASEDVLDHDAAAGKPGRSDAA